MFINELRKIADSVIMMLKTEVNYPSNHMYLGFKLPILDMAVLVEEVQLSTPGMDDDENLHTNCWYDDECLPLGQPKKRVQGLEDSEKPTTRLGKQVIYQFYSKPIAPKRTILAVSAQPLSQKRTYFTQELIRRLLKTKKDQSCAKKSRIRETPNLSTDADKMKNSGPFT